MKKFANTKYHIEVEHAPGAFTNDMDFLSHDAKSAYEHYETVKKKYQSQNIAMTEIIETREEKPLSLRRLEKIALRSTKR
ncbi:MAG TPA: hypothetical protein VJA86_00590 [Candidatus Nanoarchaeia archaeon]|nr:hypothetical protein [Candidatus Nanoarchaeia archaeon]